ncbi:unnamed protein product, partial [marine sediment metagenome]
MKTQKTRKAQKKKKPTKKIKGITGNELLKRTYEELGKAGKKREFTFKKPRECKVDEKEEFVDPVRYRDGYMAYDGAKIIEIQGNSWVVARGYASRGWLIEPYDSDLIAFGIDTKQTKKEILYDIQR